MLLRALLHELEEDVHGARGHRHRGGSAAASDRVQYAVLEAGLIFRWKGMQT